MKQRLLLLGLCLCVSTSLFADEWHSGRTDAHAPIGVMGEHTHLKDEIMVSYRYMPMYMNTNRNGTDDLSVNNVLGNYMMTPLDMTMGMHMLGGMYAPSDKLTLMAMVPYISKSMTLINRSRSELTRDASGIGDIKLSGIYELVSHKGQKFLLNTGLSLPVGSIDEKGGTTSRLPYPMQLGSGTYDLTLGGTYLKQLDAWSYGAQLLGLFRLGENKHDYTLGNYYTGTAWVSRPISNAFSTSLRGRAKVWGDIVGADSTLNTAMVPTARTDVAGKQLDLGWGLNYYAREGVLKGHRIAFEFNVPVFQSLDGVQMKQQWTAVLGWQLVL